MFVSHIDLNDNVVEGLQCVDIPAFSVQYHPEAAAGPHDAAYLFDRFVDLMRSVKEGTAMPKRTDIKSVMVIGSGPIVIGQAAEFDYSGTQACRVLREEGIRVILVNSNPATIMTDPEMADATYIEPISTPILEQIIAKERPDALLPTLGGQTALNAAMALGEAGVLKKYNVELIGASLDAIDRGEDRELFKKVVEELAPNPPAPTSRIPLRKSTRSPRSSATRWWSVRASPWVVSAPASRTTKTSCTASPAPASTIPRPTRC